MDSTFRVFVDRSQLPGQLCQEIHASLDRREFNHKFLYDSVKQSEKWLSLHEAFSPARTDPKCLGTYTRAFREVAKSWESRKVAVIGLGCGGGHKEVRLVELLVKAGVKSSFVAADVSLPLVLTAGLRFEAAKLGKEHFGKCQSWVLDLSTTLDLRRSLREIGAGTEPRLFTFFGMMPNFEPFEILPKLALALRPQDQLLVSANLAPGKDYEAGIQQVLPLYDNPQTRDWIESAFSSLGFDPKAGRLDFEISSGTWDPRLKRIQAVHTFSGPCPLKYDGVDYRFDEGERFRLFYSYRYSKAILKETLAAHGLTFERSWLTPSGEEGVFLVRRT